MDEIIRRLTKLPGIEHVAIWYGHGFLGTGFLAATIGDIHLTTQDYHPTAFDAVTALQAEYFTYIEYDKSPRHE